MVIKQTRCHTVYLVVILLAFSLLHYPSPGASDPTGDWEQADAVDQAMEVNEGVLYFLDQPPADPVHHHHNQIVLTTSSLDDGWINLRQCHLHLDPVPSLQVVYNRKRIRDLNVTAHRNIGAAWVEGHTVQLRDVGSEARLCVTAKSLALSKQSDGSYTLSNGPFMRRFLDGYYPMHVTIDVEIPVECLQLSHVNPPEQLGFSFTQAPGHLRIDAWFVGKLFTEIVLLPMLQESGAPKPCT